jgi:AraC family transcriptional regulator
MSKIDHRRTYVARINRVVDYISTHLGETLDLPTLAAVAHFSPWHFHRLFQAMTGETLADCVRRMRLEAAAQRLLASPPQAALAVALEVGFASAEVFTRAFGAHFGMTPTAWRRGGWRDWSASRREQLSKIHQEVRKTDQAAGPDVQHDGDSWSSSQPTIDKGRIMHVDIKTLPALRLGYLRHTGPYGHPGIGATWKRLWIWLGQHRLEPQQIYGIVQDDPEVTPAEKCRYDCGFEIDAAFQPQGDIGVQAFAGGRYACTPFTGTGAEIHAAWMRLLGEWLPQSGYQADDQPALELYEGSFVVDKKTGVFRCQLCMPVRPL